MDNSWSVIYYSLSDIPWKGDNASLRSVEVWGNEDFTGQGTEYNAVELFLLGEMIAVSNITQLQSCR